MPPGSKLGAERDEQCERGQAGRTDREALGDGGGGVAHAVQRVGDLADGAHVRHLGDAAGVVGHRAVGVDADGDRDDREHAERGQTDAVDAAATVTPAISMPAYAALPAVNATRMPAQTTKIGARWTSCRCRDRR
jgi:hypothetical protein